MSEKQFDPSNEEYKKVEDLPEEHQDKFTDVPEKSGGGFVDKEAMETYDAAQEASKVIGTHTDRWVTPQTILRHSADEENKRFNRENLSVQERIQEITKRGLSKSYDAMCGILEEDPELRDDEELMLGLVVSGRSYAPAQASERLRNDKHFSLEAVKRNGRALGSLSDAMRDDEEVVLEAVKQRGLSLEYASERLRDNEEIVREAVKQDGTLEDASERLRNQKDLFLESVKHYSEHTELTKIPAEMLLNDDFLITAGTNREFIEGLSGKSRTTYGDKSLQEEYLNRRSNLLRMIREAEGRKKQEENK